MTELMIVQSISLKIELQGETQTQNPNSVSTHILFVQSAHIRYSQSTHRAFTQDCVFTSRVHCSTVHTERFIFHHVYILHISSLYCMVNVNISYCFSWLFKRRQQQRHKTLVSLSDMPVNQPTNFKLRTFKDGSTFVCDYFPKNLLILVFFDNFSEPIVRLHESCSVFERKKYFFFIKIHQFS